MATAVVEAIEAEQLVFPFTGLTAIQRQQSGIARAQVTLKFPQTTLAATSAGEIKGLRFHGGLPRNFAYVFQSGSVKIGRAATTDVLSQGRGVFFENELQVQINGTTFADSFKMLNAGSTKLENDVNRNQSGSFRVFADGATAATTHHATPGVFNPWQDLYQKIYTPDYVPRIIYRGENDDVSVEVIAVNVVEDPFPASEYIALGELHFLQYDMDQAYNYL
ncbi:hypothetical protein, partial [Alteromonas sp.]|uniref:hypothetical protein n=1 Tax=Alteromonas sp. TaxID=232 RepID=UPI00257A8F46